MNPTICHPYNVEVPTFFNVCMVAQVFNDSSQVCLEKEYCKEILVQPCCEPQIECPDDVVVACCGEVQLPEIQIIDSCGIVQVTCFREDGLPLNAPFENGTTCITCVGTDGISDAPLDEFTYCVIVQDSPPVLDCPDNLTISCIHDLQDLSITGSATAFDDCQNEVDLIYQDDLSTLDAGCGEAISRTWIAVDSCGLESSCTQIITINDDIPPILINCPMDRIVPCATLPFDINVTATDNCNPNVDLSFDQVTDDADICSVVIVQTWTATDHCGNTSSCSRVVTQVDDDAPIFTSCPPDITIQGSYNEMGECDTLLSIPQPTVFDFCTMVSVTNDYNGTNDASDTYPAGVTTVTFTAVDECGNFALCSFVVTVLECPPLPPDCGDCPDNQILNGDFSDGTNVDNSNWSASEGSPQFIMDNCGNVGAAQMWGNQDLGEAIQQMNSTGNIFENGIKYRISFCARFVSSSSFSNPFVQLGFTASNANINPFTSGYNIGLSTPINDDGWMCYTLSDWTANGDFNTLTINATNNVPDVTGNNTTISWARIDNICIEPVDTVCQADFVHFANDICGKVNFNSISTGQNLSHFWDFGDGNTSTDANPMNTYASGTYTVCLTVDDGMGCMDTHCDSFSIIADDFPPNITCPDDVTIQCYESIDPANTGSSTQSDDLSNIVTIGYTDVVIQSHCPQVIERTFTAMDECGNEASCVQIITLEDNDPPHFSAYFIPVTVDCNAPYAPDDLGGFPTVADDCSDNPLISYNDVLTNPGQCPLVVERTFTAVDDCGNEAIMVHIITLDDTTNPEITCPTDITVECNALIFPSITGIATGTDDCDADVTISYSDVFDNSDPCARVVTRTWMATDDCGNESDCVQTILSIGYPTANLPQLPIGYYGKWKF